MRTGMTSNAVRFLSRPNGTDDASRPDGRDRPAVGRSKQKARLEETENLEVVPARRPPETQVVASVRLDVNGTEEHE